MVRKAVFGIALGLILGGVPVHGQSWLRIRDELLGSGRGELMVACAQGRQSNSIRESYWEYNRQALLKQYLLTTGVSMGYVKQFMSGLAAAMSLACPEVW